MDLHRYLDWGGEDVRILALYAPNEDSPKFFNEVAKNLVDYDGKLIIGGDFNLTQNFRLDTLDRKTEGNVKAARMVHNIQEVFNLVDVWRTKNKNIRKFTCVKHNKSIKGTTMSRIDFFLISKELIANIQGSDILPGYKSDHAIPYLIIKTEFNKHGPGFWRLNTSLLKENEYASAVRDIIKEEKVKPFQNVFEKIMFIKARVRGFSIQYSTRKKKSQINKYNAIDRKINFWNEELVMLKENLWDQKSKQQAYDDIEEIEKHLTRLDTEKIELVNYRARGAAIRARRNWYLYGEKASQKYFFQLEKDNYRKKNRMQLMDEKGQLHTSNSEILKIQDDFYEKLYTSQKIKIHESYLEGLNLKTLSDFERLDLEQTITTDEIKKAIFDMPDNKVPGNDGLPVEFYKFFYNELEGILVEVIKTAAREGFPEKMSQGIISLLEKADKNLLLIANWRPLSLLNVDFKVLSKILANRLYRVLPNIIHQDQTGFIPKRSLCDNMLDLISLMDWCDKVQIEALLVSFDFRKAFDSVEYEVLFRIMEEMNFGPLFIYMIKSLFTNM